MGLEAVRLDQLRNRSVAVQDRGRREHDLQLKLRMRLDRLHGGFDARVIRARTDDDTDFLGHFTS
jgi:hypothetical protein